jgi:hypothetical protein
VGVQRLQQFLRLRDVGVIDHVGIIASTAPHRAAGKWPFPWPPDLGRARQTVIPPCLPWQRSRSSLLTLAITTYGTLVRQVPYVLWRRSGPFAYEARSLCAGNGSVTS